MLDLKSISFIPSNPVLRRNWLLIAAIFAGSCIKAQEVPEALFKEINDESWQIVFKANDEDWTKDWFLDGLRGSVKNTSKGMVFSAGPVRGDHGSHNVLWTRQSFEGDVKIEFDYTRLDAINYAVNILYILATGKEEGPFEKDISVWSDLREVPYMSSYFRNMNLLHISFAAYPLEEEPESDYVRARRYPVKEGERFSTSTRLAPDYFKTGLFKPGVTYHFTAIKKQNHLFLEVKNETENIRKLFYWDTSSFDPVTEGRIGIRHMYTRAARYGNFTVSQP